MRDFLFLFIGGHESEVTMSPEEMQLYMSEWTDWIGKMTADGIYKGGHPLEPEARTIAGIDKVVTDGPFAEAKEVVGGYVLISSTSMDDAVVIARDCPIYAKGGRVEVRMIHEMEI